MKTKPTSLILRLVARFCLIGVPVYLALCFALILAYQDYRKAGLEDEIAAEVAATGSSIARALGPVLADGRAVDTAKTILSVSSGTRALVCLDAQTKAGESIARWPGFPCSTLKQTPSFTVPIRHNNVILGHLVSHYSTDWAREKLNRESAFVYSATAIGAAGAFIAFILAYHFAVGRRIGALQHAIDHRRRTGQDRLVDIGSGDPLGDVGKAYNAMLEAARQQAEAVVHAQETATSMARQAASARAAHEARTKFLESASHELRTPLNGIMGAAEILSGTNLTARQKRGSMLLRDASERLEATIASILEEAASCQDGKRGDPNQETTEATP